jgi:protease I
MNVQPVLAGKRIAILATDGFEFSELTSPRDTLIAAGATVHIVSQKDGSIRGWSGKDWADTVAVDKTLQHAKATDYDALVLPGGLINPDTLRQDEKAIHFIQAFLAIAPINRWLPFATAPGYWQKLGYLKAVKLRHITVLRPI